MLDYGYSEPPPLEEALVRLAKARERLLWLQCLLWGWLGLAIAWTLPVGPWSATRLPGAVAAVIGCAVIAGGVGLALLHRWASDTSTIQTTLDEAHNLTVVQISRGQTRGSEAPRTDAAPVGA